MTSMGKKTYVNNTNEGTKTGWKELKQHVLDEHIQIIKKDADVPFNTEKIMDVNWLKENIPELKDLKSAKKVSLSSGLEGREKLRSGGGMASLAFRLVLEYEKNGDKKNAPKSLVVKLSSTEQMWKDFSLGFLMKNWYITRCLLWRPLLAIFLPKGQKFSKSQYNIPKKDFDMVGSMGMDAWLMFQIQEPLFYSHKICSNSHYDLAPKAYYANMYASKAGFLNSKTGHIKSIVSTGIENIHTCVIVEDLTGFVGPKGQTITGHQNINKSVYIAALSHLAKFHAAGWGKCKSEEMNMIHRPTTSRLVYLFLNDGFPNCFQSFLKNDLESIREYWKPCVPPLELENIQIMWKDLQRKFASENNMLIHWHHKNRKGEGKIDTIIHGDAHLWNYMWRRKDGCNDDSDIAEIKMMDMQAVAPGLAAFDIAYMLAQDFEAFTTYDHFMEMFEVYYKVLEKELSEKSLDQSPSERYEKVKKDFLCILIMFYMTNGVQALANKPKWIKRSKKDAKKIQEPDWLKVAEDWATNRVHEAERIVNPKPYKNNWEGQQIRALKDGHIRRSKSGALNSLYEIYIKHPELFGDCLPEVPKE